MKVVSFAHITRILNALQVRSQYVTIGVKEENDNIYVLVHKPNSKDVFRIVFRASEFINDQKYVQKELHKAALFYHGGSIPVSQTPWQRMWQDMANCWMATPWVLRAGIVLVVIASLAKWAGVYK